MIAGVKKKFLTAFACAMLALAGTPALALADEVEPSSSGSGQTAAVVAAGDLLLLDTTGDTDGTESQVPIVISPSPTTTEPTTTEPVTNVTYMNMYRLFNPNSGEHFYTSDWNEATNVALAGWRLEGIGWVAPSAGDPVYRLYNANGGDHHYTLSKGEHDLLVEAGWSDEGIGWYSDNTAGGANVYRQYNPNATSGSHNFTMSEGESNLLVESGWTSEGVAWKASSIGATDVAEGWISNGAGDRIYVNHNATVNIGLFYIDDVLYCGDTAGKVLRNQVFSLDNVRYEADNEGALSLAPIPEGYEAIFGEIGGLSSATDYAIVVDCTENKVGVFEGSAGNWSLINNFDCTSGALYMPTVKGTFTLTDRGEAFGTNVYTCYYYTRIYGDYLFHSVLYDAGTYNIQDGRLGENLSHGCVRLAIENAKWIYDNMPYGTTVRII